MNYAESKLKRTSAQKTLEGMAKEDARYISSLSMETQVGTTLNARQIEKAISRLSSSKLAENRGLAVLMLDVVKPIMPSAIKYSDPTDFFGKTRPDLEQMTDKYLSEVDPDERQDTGFIARRNNVTLIDYDLDTENKILAAIMHSSQGSTGLIDSTLSYPALLNLARKSIGNYLETGKKISESEEIPLNLKKNFGVFVTLTLDGVLRGCIGYIEPIMPVYKAVAQNAINAAFSDSRFEPLTKKEFLKIN